MANGFLDFFTGGGQYADPNQIDPNTGAPYGAVRQAFFNQLGNVGAALMAAGQPVDPSVRAQLLSQVGGFGSGMQRDIFNASQARLMQSQVQTAEQERQRVRNLGERIKDPEFVKSLGLTQDQAAALGPKGIADVLEKKATQDPAQRALTMLQLQKTQSEMDQSKAMREAIYRYYGMGNQPAQGGVSTTAPSAPSTPGTVPSQPVAPGGAPAAAPMMSPIGIPVTPEMQLEAISDPTKALGRITQTQMDIAKNAWTTISEDELRRMGYTGTVPRGTLIQRSAGGAIEFKEPKDPEAETRQYGAKTQIDYLEKTLRPAAQQAASTVLPNLYKAQEALQGGVITGALAGQQLQLRKVGQLFGIGNPDTIKDTETFKAYLAQNVLPFMQAFGGSDTIEEMRLVQSFVGGDITLDEASLRRILAAQEVAARNAIGTYNQEREALSSYLPKGAGVIKMPERPLPTSVQPDNVQRRPPQTGGMGSAQPPVAGAQLAPDGNWYVKQGNQYFLVK